ncbi:hypothetical protein [Acaryochloris sp. IP29b_bin.148]|uniref:hypothetical protein n=1 Tax=Acaryochloris sp. IP29b_bin.148 TaxID=2969218 RepID=UPI0026118F31|nr:hypothetical protein [Acaryochloris sp. IP29b_bin.148]
MAQPTAFLGSKALLAVQGPEPSFVATGYAFPPLLVYGSALVRSPVTVQVLCGAVLVGTIVRTMGRLEVARFWQILWSALLLLHPALGLMLLRDPTWVATTLLLLITTRLLWQILYPQDLPLNFLVVLVGLSASGLMLLRFEAWWGLVFILITLWCLLWQETWQYRAAALFIVGTMCLFAIGTCVYLNWLATGNPLAFLSQPGSGIRLPGLDSFLVQAGLGESILKILRWMLQIAPVYLLVMLWLMGRTQAPLQVGLIIALPIVLLLINLWEGLYTPNLSQFGVYLALLPLLLEQLPSRQSWRKLLITLGLVLSLVSSGWVLQTNQVIPDEILLWRQLTHQALPELQPVQAYHQMTIEQRTIATYLFQMGQPQQHILMDDRLHFPILYLLHHTEGLILPHQYEFEVALEEPEQWVNLIVVAGAQSPLRMQDAVRRPLAQQRNIDPEAQEGLTLPGFKTVFDFPNYQVLQRL